MPSALERFNVGLYTEHLEEASSLYDLRHALLAEPDREWRSLHDFEERLEAHLDALVIGGPLALQVCAEKAQEGDAGELFAAVCVCCRHKDARYFAEIWRQLDVTDAQRVRAVTEALRSEFPADWAAASDKAIARADAGRLSVLSVVLAHRRLPMGSQIAARLAAEQPAADPGVIRALGQLQTEDVLPALRSYLESSDAEVRSNALRALVLAGDERALHQSYLHAQVEDWPHLAMGLAGDRQAAAILRRQIESGRGSRPTVLGLALLGDLSAVRTLTGILDSEELGETAALALHWITGADLYVDVFIPEPIDERELFERELEAFRERGEVPRRADGRPYGSEVRQLTRDPAAWNQWLAEHAHDFDSNLRYRRGELYGPRQLFQCLTARAVPLELRRLAYEELVVRYRCPEPFEADDFVADQVASLRRIAHWLQRNEARFEHRRGAFERAGMS